MLNALFKETDLTKDERNKMVRVIIDTKMAAGAEDAADEQLPTGRAINDNNILTWGPAAIQIAADQGFAHAQYILAVMYLQGRGVKQNYTKAARYLHLAAYQGFAHAQYKLGTLYSVGC